MGAITLFFLVYLLLIVLSVLLSVACVMLGIGIISGYLGAAPSVLWASGAMFIAMAPILVPVAIWIYTLVFAFSSLWFAHFTLAALEQLRKENNAERLMDKAQPAIKTIVIDEPPRLEVDKAAGQVS